MDGCREECSYPEHDLKVYEEEPICEGCYEDLDLGLEPPSWNSLPDFVSPESARLAALEARCERYRKALVALVSLNDTYSPFGGEIMEDRIDRTWENARAALSEEVSDGPGGKPY
jgi:hypothetical protein